MFYGWYIVAASCLINATISAFTFFGFTAFVKPIATTLGFSYVQISLALSIRGMETAALDPLMGMVADRWPPRRLVLIGVVIIGLGLLCLSQVTNLAVFYMSFLIMGLGGALGLMIVPVTTIARWFRRNLGKATGVMLMGTGIGGLLIPVIVKLIDAYGWRTSLIILAVATWIIGIPVSLVFRSRPQDYGLLPDGKQQADSKGGASSQSQDFGVSAREAVKMRAFWHIGIVNMLLIGTGGTVYLHVMPYLSSVGMERSTASMVAMAVCLAAIPGRLGWGWLGDVSPKKYVIAAALVLTSIGLFFFSLIDAASSFMLIAAFVVVFGLCVVGLRTVTPAILREYFGIKRFGTIFGLTSVFTTIGTAICQPMAGWMYDTRGVYDPIWLVYSGLCLAAAIVMLTIPPASRKV